MNRLLWEERFGAYLGVRGRSPETVRTYRRVLRPFLEFIEAYGLSSLSDLTPDLLEEYRVHLFSRRFRGRPLSRSYQVLNLAGVKAFLAFLHHAGYLPLDLGARLELPATPRNVPRAILTEAEVRMLLECQDLETPFGVRNRAILELLYGTAMRNMELVQLKLYELDLVSGLVRIERGKGGRSRVVPLGEESRFWLSEYLKRSRPLLGGPVVCQQVFLTSRHQPFSGHTLTVLVARLAREAGLRQRVTPHALRHSCATHMLRRGAGLRHLQKMLGHQTPTSTQIYTHVEVSDLRRVLERCHPRERSRQ